MSRDNTRKILLQEAKVLWVESKVKSGDDVMCYWCGQNSHLKSSCPVPEKSIHYSKCRFREHNTYAACKGKLDKQSPEKK